MILERLRVGIYTIEGLAMTPEPSGFRVERGSLKTALELAEKLARELPKPSDPDAGSLGICVAVMPIQRWHRTRIVRRFPWGYENPKNAPPRVVESIVRAFPKDAAVIIRELRFHGFDRFWSFERWGMFVGVELDGYIHT